MDINIIGFIPALLPIALSPGASFTLAMNNALSGGRRGLVKTLTGTALGIYTHAFLIGLGITTLLVASPTIFSLLKYIGTAYLLWLGFQLLRSGIKSADMQLSAGGTTTSLTDAWMANVLNPKAMLFYLTVVTQFVGSHSNITSYLALASIHILVMTVWLLIVSKAVVFSSRKLNPARLKKYVNTGGGCLLILFSLKSLFF